MTEYIWVIGGGAMQYVHCHTIKLMGYGLVVSDGDPNAVCRSLADYFYVIDTFDEDAHIETAMEVRCNSNIVGVVTIAADCHKTVTRMCECLGLPSVPLHVSEVCRDKSKFRQLMMEESIRQPQYRICPTVESANDFLSVLNMDVVLKSTDNSGSRGMQYIPQGGTITFEMFSYSESLGTTGSVLVEEKLIDDPNKVSESSIETLWINGQCHYVNMVDRLFPRDLVKIGIELRCSAANDSVELAHINPTQRSTSDIDTSMDLMRKIGNALGLNSCEHPVFLKGDLYFTSQGPIILEATPRLSGGWDSSYSSICRGLILAVPLVHMAMNKRKIIDSTLFEAIRPTNQDVSVVVTSQPPDHAIDCIGREFAIAWGSEPISELLESSLRKLNEGDFISYDTVIRTHGELISKECKKFEAV
jgi:biotin carboxylase